MAEPINNFEINDDELDNVSGGVLANVSGNNEGVIKSHCPHCNKVTSCKIFSGGRIKCLQCNTTFEG